MQEILEKCFGSLEDPRVERTRKHHLIDIIAIAICSVLSGAETFEEMEDFAHHRRGWFSTFLPLPNGIPSHDTIGRVFKLLEPDSFQKATLEWLKALINLLPEKVIPVDGKTLRGSKRSLAGHKGLHILNAWSCVNQICLGQLQVDEKSNEIPAVPELLKQLAIKGAIVTLDAMGAQKDTTRDIQQADADYIISLKGNQGQLHELVKETFSLCDQGQKTLSVYHADDEIASEHGRIDERHIEVIPTDLLKDQVDAQWVGLNSIVRIISKRSIGDDTSKEARFYISSLPATEPETILMAIRAHWQVECLHWHLDITFREDNCRIREVNAATNYSWLRKCCLGLLKKEKSFRASIRRKQRKAFENQHYLEKLLKF